MLTIFVFSGGLLAFTLIYLLLVRVYGREIAIQSRLEGVESIGKVDFNVREDLNLSFGERVLRPGMDRLVGIFAILIPMNEATQDKLTQQLKQADVRMGPREYRASVVLVTTAVMTALFLYASLLRLSFLYRFLFGFLGLYAGLVLSRFQLKRKITQRRLEIYKQLPETLDLLSVSVSAGLGFDQALSYIVEKMEGTLIRELDITQREITMGMRRKIALERLADRCDVEEVYVFVSAVNQADELGSSMKNVLETQASSVRLSHKQKVEEEAQKLAVKIMLPMVLFILPVTFIIILGPAVPSIFEALGGL